MLDPTLRRGAPAVGAAIAVAVDVGSAALAQPIAKAPAFTAAELVRQPAHNWVTNGGNVYNQRYSTPGDYVKVNASPARNFPTIAIATSIKDRDDKALFTGTTPVYPPSAVD